MTGGLHFSFGILGEQQVNRTLLNVSAAAKDMAPAWNTLADRLAVLEAGQFASQGGNSGGWQALSPGYAKWKARHYPGKPILQATGDGMRSLTVRPFAIEHITPSAMTLGTDIPYMKYHQHGGGSLPRRRVVELPEAERRAWVKVIQAYIRAAT